MAEMKHTPEPWIIEHDPDGVPYIWRDGTSHFVTKVTGVMDTEANASRIVACVNACKGINPEAVPELLAALKDVRDLLHPYNHRTPWNRAEAIIDAAIAKAESNA